MINGEPEAVFIPQKEVKAGTGSVRVTDLITVFGDRLARMPHVLRLLAENHLRTSGDVQGLSDAVDQWLQGGDVTYELMFQPNRILMHDTTCTPALVDIAAIRDLLADANIDPSSLSPQIPVDVCIDHSTSVDVYASSDSLIMNQNFEIKRNRERYSFLKWADHSMDTVTVYPPGSGIMHTINLEQLATLLVYTGDGHAYPDMMLGTDSHTPMINGIGVLGWGVGGLEAESVIFGQPVALAFPKVVGVELTGELGPGVFATDLALEITHRLRELNVTGCFVEFYGKGTATLSADERAVIANMAPEYGATTGFFPCDKQSVNYLERTARPDSLTDCIEPVLRAQGLWFDPCEKPLFIKKITVALDSLRPTIAGPRRPQDTLSLSNTKQAVEAVLERELLSAGQTNLASMSVDGDVCSVPDGAIGIAAITSCTNTSSPELLVAAGLLAKKANEFGLRPPAWVKTSLAPGSTSAGAYLKRAGLLEELARVGFDIVGYGCTTCIGNSGPLPDIIDTAVDDGRAIAAVISGNRNFPGRVHPKLDLCFLASPPLVLAFALKGSIDCDIWNDPIGYSPNNTQVFLRDLWPTKEAISKELEAVFKNEDIPRCFEIANQSDSWASITAPETPLFPWDNESIQLRYPRFVTANTKIFKPRFTASPLLVLGDDMTTDHISPAGAISAQSEAGRWLTERGADPAQLNVYAAYRGNWEVMLRGLFTNSRAQNYLATNLPIAHTELPDGARLPLHEAADILASENRHAVILAGDRYGMGSSRDWAAKGVALLGVKAIIARGFERIHRLNLIGMGVVPLQISNDFKPCEADITPADIFQIDLVHTDLGDQYLNSANPLLVQWQKADETLVSIPVVPAIETRQEMDILRQGGVLPTIFKRYTQES